MPNWSPRIFEWISSTPEISWQQLPAELRGPFENFLSSLDISFDQLSLLLEALAHRSFVHELQAQNPQRILSSNERHEFLGDACLGLIVSLELFQRYPQASEGELSKHRGSLVNQEILAQWSRLLGLSEWVLVGRSEWMRQNHIHDSLLSDTFEAIIGAYFMANGLDKARELMQRIWWIVQQKQGTHPLDQEHLLPFDPKTQLQEKAMALFGQFPVYLSEEIPDPQGTKFLMKLCLGDHVLLQAPFDSKKKGSKELARMALQQNLLAKISQNDSGVSHAD